MGPRKCRFVSAAVAPAAAVVLAAAVVAAAAAAVAEAAAGTQQDENNDDPETGVVTAHCLKNPFSAQMIVFSAYAVRDDTQIRNADTFPGRGRRLLPPSAPYYAPARAAVTCRGTCPPSPLAGTDQTGEELRHV